MILETNWNELVLSKLVQQFLKMSCSFPDQFCCEPESCNLHCVSHGSLVVLCTRSPQLLIAGADAEAAALQFNTSYASMGLPSIDLGKPFSSYPSNCQSSPSGIQSRKLLSHISSGPKFDGNVLTAALVSKFIFAHSELPYENEVTDCVLCLFTIFVPSNTIPGTIPSVKTPAVIPCVRTPFFVNPRRVGQYQPVPIALIPEFPSMFPSSSFPDLRCYFRRFSFA